MVDFVANAKSMGADGNFVDSLEEFESAFKRARESAVTFIIHIKVSKYDWTEYADTWWEVGVPEVSQKEKIQRARAMYESNANKQRKGV